MTLQNQDAITRFFAGKGLTAAQIAGIEGNLQIESGGNPSAVNPGENAHGIAQWEGGRWTALQSYAKSAGSSPTDLTTQLNFYWSELQGSERGAMSALLSAATPTQAATAIQSQYERSSSTSLQARIDAANKIAAGGVQGGSGAALGSSSATGQQTGITSSIAGAFVDGLHLVDVLIAVIGAALILLAISILARVGGGGSSSPSSSAGPARTRTRPHTISRIPEEAAEVAA